MTQSVRMQGPPIAQRVVLEDPPNVPGRHRPAPGIEKERIGALGRFDQGRTAVP